MSSYETCRECDSETGRAGASEDSLYHSYVGPFCEDCYDDWPDKIEAELAKVRREFRDFRAGQAVSVPEETLTAIRDTLRLVWSRELSADDGLDEIEILISSASADVPEGWDLTRESENTITIAADGIGLYVAQLNGERVSEILLYALANDLLNDTPAIPNSDYIRALQGACDIIQADANTEQNYGSLCRTGNVLARLKSNQEQDQ